MTDLHVIFRRSGDSWDAYSRPTAIYTGGRTLEQARDEFTQAATGYFGEEWPEIRVLEHLERPASEGIYVRTAIDRHTLTRDHAARILRRSLTVKAQREQVESEGLLAATGDAVFVTCLASDRLSWLIGQLSRVDHLHVCVAAPGNLLWWTAISAPDAEGLATDAETLAELGLSGDDITIGDLMTSDQVVVQASGQSIRRTAGTRPSMLSGRRLVAA